MHKAARAAGSLSVVEVKSRRPYRAQRRAETRGMRMVDLSVFT